ncbi:glycosyltransferase [Salinirubrum litoreum]|uniref:Glycosyltransferase n=1 Tax=Salinirubrum litoreum TaxID=1126234 RepID=A0ABD5R6K8_9EURY|nr:glycosyltransferase [Salinirubrum litoreum]
MHSVAAFTDTYLPTVNGVTYTVKTWRDRWQARGGRMDVVYPGASGYSPDDGEFPVRSLPFPFYDGFRFGLPRVPTGVAPVDVVHAHTPFALGLAGSRLASRSDAPLVASYHTPTGEYASYLTSRGPIEDRIEALSERYERWFFSKADAVVVPSEATRRYLLDEVEVHERGPRTTVRVVPNGVDVDRFRPVDGDDFRQRYRLGDRPLVGYTGRHGYEKCLSDILDAVAGLDVTVVFGGDGPARADLEREAAERDLDARFLGFLDREELPGFYSALDAFLFPSPVETQGLVALEANACGTPVVGVDAGALSGTIEEGVTGYHYPEGDTAAFRDAIRRTLDEGESLQESCLARRAATSVENAVDELGTVYDDVLAG